jgi:hypothetical protein
MSAEMFPPVTLPPPSGAPGPALDPTPVIVPVTIPTLSAEQKGQALQILENDPAVKQLEGYEYRIEDSGPWLEGEPPEYGVRGVGFELSFPNPVPAGCVLGEWPYFRVDEADNSKYTEETMRVTEDRAEKEFAGRHVEKFSAIVDLQRGKLIELMPRYEFPYWYDFDSSGEAATPD